MKPGPTSPAMTDEDRAGLDSTWLHSDPADFWARVHKTECCWIFTKTNGQSLLNSYGVMYFRGFAWRAHRLSWALTRGPIPDGMLVLHRCDVPSCVNPDHLFIGTDLDNNRDRAAKVKAGRFHLAPTGVCPECREPDRTFPVPWLKREFVQ